MFFLLLLTRAVQAANPAVSANADQQVKAAFVYNFAKFAEWPADRLQEGSPIVIGLLSAGGIGNQIAATVRDRQIDHHPIVVRVVTTPVEIRAVHLLFVANSDQARFAELAPGLRETGILTVGEAPDFARTGGVIGFVLSGNKVNFEISPEAAERAGVKLSSQLLKLATIVPRKG